MKANKYEVLRKSRYRKQLKERNDCSVMAIAISCRLSYKKAHELLASFGRINRKGLDTFTILRAAQYLGYTVNPVEGLIQKSGSKFTPKTIGSKLKNGYYLAFVNRHVLGVVNGVVFDWSKNRQHHIYEAYKITKKRQTTSGQKTSL